MRSPSEGLGARTATDEFGGTQFGPRQTTGGKGKSPHPDCETGGPKPLCSGAPRTKGGGEHDPAGGEHDRG